MKPPDVIIGLEKQRVTELNQSVIKLINSGTQFYRKLDSNFIKINLKPLSLETILLLLAENKLYY